MTDNLISPPHVEIEALRPVLSSRAISQCRKIPLQEEVNPTPGEMDAVLYLTRGYIAVIDAELYPLLSQHKWTALVNRGKVYAVRWGKKSEGNWFRKFIYLHRQIAGIVDVPTLVVDHRNGFSLDNRKSNFRIVTQAGNNHNLSTRVDGGRFRGVYVYPIGTKHFGTCQSVVSVGRKKHHCGTWPATEEGIRLAALARDKKLMELLPSMPIDVLNNLLNFPMDIEKITEKEIPF